MQELRRRWLSTVGLAAAMLLAIGGASAQDALTVAPKVFKKVTENARMRVLEANFPPGQKVGLHSFSDHLIYMLTPGTLVIKPPGRTPYEMTFTPGEAVFLPAQTRATENDGREAVRALIVELKAAAPAQARRAKRSKRAVRGKRGRRR